MVAWPSRMRSVSSQASIAAAVATVVVTNVEPASRRTPSPNRR